MKTVLYAMYDARQPTGSDPIYIGIGNESKRPETHWKLHKSKGHYNYLLRKVLDRHLRDGLEPIVKVLVRCPSFEYAADLERKLIASYGRRSVPSERGPLCNLTAGGEGPDPLIMRDEKVRAKVSASLKKKYAEDTDFATRQSKNWREIINHPNTVKAKSDAAKKRNAEVWSNPALKAQRVKSMQGKTKTMSEAALEVRRNASAKAKNSAEAKAKISAAAKAMWADPEFRKAMAEKRRQAWQDPAKRENMLRGRSEGIAASWENQEVKQRRIDGIKKSALK